MHARTAAARIESLRRLGPLSQGEVTAALQILTNIALAHKNEHRYEDAIRYARQAVEAPGWGRRRKRE